MRGRRDRVARPQEARAAALPRGDRALWATALYAGLRRGELQGLRWQDVDLETGLIRVERSFACAVSPRTPERRDIPGTLVAEAIALALRGGSGVMRPGRWVARLGV